MKNIFILSTLLMLPNFSYPRFSAESLCFMSKKIAKTITSDDLKQAPIKEFFVQLSQNKHDLDRYDIDLLALFVLCRIKDKNLYKDMVKFFNKECKIDLNFLVDSTVNTCAIYVNIRDFNNIIAAKKLFDELVEYGFDPVEIAKETLILCADELTLKYKMYNFLTGTCKIKHLSLLF